MGKKYAKYRNKLYKIDIIDEKVELISKNPNDRKHGFSSYVDILGDIHDDILIKVVNENDLTAAYNLKLKAVYQGKKYTVNSVGKFLLHDPIILFSRDIEDMNNNGFRRMDKFTFEKEVSINTLEALIEYKKPILRFSHMEEQITKIESNEIEHYLL